MQYHPWELILHGRNCSGFVAQQREFELYIPPRKLFGDTEVEFARQTTKLSRDDRSQEAKALFLIHSDFLIAFAYGRSSDVSADGSIAPLFPEMRLLASKALSKRPRPWTPSSYQMVSLRRKLKFGGTLTLICGALLMETAGGQGEIATRLAIHPL